MLKIHLFTIIPKIGFYEDIPQLQISAPAKTSVNAIRTVCVLFHVHVDDCAVAYYGVWCGGAL